jgi:CheY-like chemotaxis protein
MVPLKQILLAEDSEQDAELTLDALREYRLANDVVVARDGQEALDYLGRQGRFENRLGGDPGLILLDLKMPRVNGLEVLAAIRRDARLGHIPVVVLTSSREEPDLQAAYALGVNAYVVKPVDFFAFIEAVRTIGQFWITLNENPPPLPGGGKGPGLG